MPRSNFSLRLAVPAEAGDLGQGIGVLVGLDLQAGESHGDVFVKFL